MSELIMSEDMQDEFKDRLQTIDTVVKIGWWILAGAFALGVWVTTLQIAVNNNTLNNQIGEARLRDLELKESVSSERLAAALKILEKIDHKLNP
ncbi:MAG: hypothetical protein EBS21_06100 [Sphingomonadaceae bacterium]|nr:hypothetical protein [Sphingomonadaceae bacterium]